MALEYAVATKIINNCARAVIFLLVPMARTTFRLLKNIQAKLDLLDSYFSCSTPMPSGKSQFTFQEVAVGIVHFWWLRLSYSLLWNRIALSNHTVNTSFHTASYTKFFWSFCSYQCAKPHPTSTSEKKIALTENQESHLQG